MELGALQCLPKNPDCSTCPLLSHCLAFAHHTVEERPVKEKRLKIRTRYFHYLVISDTQQLILHRRESGDIWQGLYDFPCIESDHLLTFDDVIGDPLFMNLIQDQPFELTGTSPQHTHKLTHQTIIATFFKIKISEFSPIIQENNLFLVSENELEKYPIPKLIDNYLNS